MKAHGRCRVHPLLGGALCGVLVLLSTACMTTGRPAAAMVSSDGEYSYETFPRYEYDGGYVYLVGDRWYHQRGGSWAYYRDEPPDLWAHRQRYYASYGHASPPQYGAPPEQRGRYIAPTPTGAAEQPADPVVGNPQVPVQASRRPRWQDRDGASHAQPGASSTQLRHGPQPGQNPPPPNNKRKNPQGITGRPGTGQTPGAR